MVELSSLKEESAFFVLFENIRELWDPPSCSSHSKGVADLLPVLTVDPRLVGQPVWQVEANRSGSRLLNYTFSDFITEIFPYLRSVELKSDIFTCPFEFWYFFLFLIYDDF